jgi:hypothetical protein
MNLGIAHVHISNFITAQLKRNVANTFRVALIKKIILESKKL